MAGCTSHRERRLPVLLSHPHPIAPPPRGFFVTMPTSVEHELLVDPFRSVYAVNCRVEGSTLYCGALYVEPQHPFRLIRLAYGDASIEVELPAELINQSVPSRAWQVALPLRDE